MIGAEGLPREGVIDSARRIWTWTTASTLSVNGSFLRGPSLTQTGAPLIKLSRSLATAVSAPLAALTATNNSKQRKYLVMTQHLEAARCLSVTDLCTDYGSKFMD